MNKKATEIEYLRWFYKKCDFGPAHGDVMDGMREYFLREEKKEPPEGYGNED